MAVKIDRMPPRRTGDLAEDMKNTEEYLFYLYEQLNRIISSLEKI